MFLATITLRVFFVFLFIRPQIQSVKPGPLMWNSKAQKTDATLNFQSFFNFHPQLFFNPVPCHPPVNQRSKPVFFTAPQSAWRYFARTRKYHRGRNQQRPKPEVPTVGEKRRSVPGPKKTRDHRDRWWLGVFFSCLVLGVPFVGLGGVVSCWGCLGVGYLDDMSFWKARNGSPQKVSWETSCKLHIPTGADDVYTRKT